MTYQQARALLPRMSDRLAHYGTPGQYGFEVWYRADGRVFILRELSWGEWTACSIRSVPA